MFCKYCGSPSETEVCPSCAAARQQSAPQVQPKPQKPAATGNFLELVKSKLTLIIAGIAVIALIFGLLNVFSAFDVNVTGSGWGAKQSEYVSVSDCEAMSGGTMLYVGNILFGIACLGAAAIGILYFLKMNKNMPYYDQYIASKLKFRPAFMVGALVAAGALLQVIFYLFCKEEMLGIKVTVGVNWTTWLLLVIFAGVAVVDKFVLEAKEKVQQ